jgi:uncharacterized Zn finger protein
MINFKINPDATLPIACPQCSEKEDQLVSRLRGNPDLVCGSCGLTFNVNADQIDAVLKMFKGLNR